MFIPPEQRQDPRLDSISTAKLTDIARRALGDRSIQLRSWRRAPVQGGSGGAIGGTAIHRFTWLTTCDKSWSVILKVLYRRPKEKQDAPYYWKREYEVYHSGMLAKLPPGCFATPKIYAQEALDDCCWLWMEDIHDLKLEWTLDDYQSVARRLGSFNGAYPSKRRLPKQKWLTNSWHCAIVPALAETFRNLDSYLENPLARRTLPIETKTLLQSIWHERATYMQVLRTLPKTLCHIDAFRRNILHRQQGPVLIDWAAAGNGALGEELVALVAVSAYHEGLSYAEAAQLDRVVFAAYLEGLAASGWRGEAKQVRLGYTCAMVLRGLAGVKQDIDLLTEPACHQGLLDNFKRDDIGEVADFFAEVRRYRLLDMAAEARDLLKN